MSKKHFSLLFGITIAALALVLMVPSRTGRESTFEPQVWLPQLAGKVNEIDSLRLIVAGGEVLASFERQGDEWQLVEASSYPADWSRLKSLLLDLAKAELIEEKTSNPDYYPRLGVEDVSAEDAGGILIEFAAATGLPALIAGNKATGREGQYARLVDEKSTVLIDVTLDLPRERTQWLEQDIVDISDGEVVQLNITHADGEFVSALKKSADDSDFELQEIPAGREIKSSWSVNSIAGGLSALDLEAVAADSDFDWSEASGFSLLTADGLKVSADLLEVDEKHWIRLHSEAYVNTDVSNESESAEPLEAYSPGPADLDQRVRHINDRVSGWAYQIPKHKYDAMSKRMDDLLQAEESP